MGQHGQQLSLIQEVPLQLQLRQAHQLRVPLLQPRRQLQAQVHLLVLAVPLQLVQVHLLALVLLALVLLVLQRYCLI